MKKTTLAAAVISACLALPANAATTNKLYPQHFPLNEVTLGDSPMRDAMMLNIKTLMAYDVDRLMTPFIRQAGLSSTTDKSSKYYQWTTKHPSFPNWALSSWSLEGHVGGHYLTALALAIAATDGDGSAAEQNKQLRERLSYCIDIMKDCQDAYDANTQGLKGFIGGQPINGAWTGLYSGNTATYTQYGGWVPFYCQHKILAGLRDAYVYAGDETAKEMFRKICDWSIDVVAKMSDATMQSSILNWEHGGMNETLADAYHIFGDAKYLKAARKYSHTYEINGMQSLNKSFLDGQHANTQVPKFIGFERIFQLDPTATTYQKAAHNFWTDVTENRTVCIGGNSVDEHFLAASASARYISNLNGPESCNSNNMLKLSEALFDETHEGKYADFYEQAMLNHILSTQDPQTGGYVYFTTLRPQSYRIYSRVNQGMWCCVGTGMENHSKYGHFIYTESEDGETLYVNLFTASTLNNSRFGIKQETNFPFEQQTKLTVSKAGTYSIAVRKPSWVTGDYVVRVNGADVNAAAVKGYVTINRSWSEGDVIEVSLPMALRTEQCPGLKEYIAFKYGPVLLAARTTAATAAEASATGLQQEKLQNEYAGDERMGHAPGSYASSRSITTSPMLICNTDTVLNLIKVKDVSKLLFTISAPAGTAVNAPSSLFNNVKELTLEPFYGIHHARYNCYWYAQSAEDFAKSDLGQSEAMAAALDSRTLDYVGTGEQQSEAGHETKYSSESTSGSYNGETYRDYKNGGYVQYELDNTRLLKDSLAIMCRFTTADKGRAGTITLDGQKLADVTIPEAYPTQDDKGFYNVEYRIPASLLTKADGTPKEKFVFRISATTAFGPGLYYLRLVKLASADDVSQGSYRFNATDWTTCDAGRVAASKFVYNADNTFTVNAGTGSNNVALKMDYEKYSYTVNGARKYITVRGTNLKTTAGASYLWWLNGINKGTQVAPAKVVTLKNGEVVIAWDVAATGLSENSMGMLYSFNQFTCFGLTSTTGQSTINDITFVEDIDEYITAQDAPTEVVEVQDSAKPVIVDGKYAAAGRVVIVNNRKRYSVGGVEEK